MRGATVSRMQRGSGRRGWAIVGSIAVLLAAVGVGLIAPAVGVPAAGTAAATVSTPAPSRGEVASDPLTIRTADGVVHGLSVPTSGGTRQFLGIPFAQPPVGALRWRAPQPAKPWTGTLQATRTGSSCPQILPVVNVAIGSEDCLHLNVFVPKAVPSTPRPVMVWIYGGGFTEGSATDDSPANFAAAHDTIAVSFNYRLGPLGFLALPALARESADHATGDEGLQDQQAALRWVQKNIASFGGDPHDVTIFGESAGGISVCAQLLSPAAGGLFQKGITESGPCTLPSIPLGRAEAEGAALASKLGCGSSSDQLACMRSRPGAQVLSAMPPDPALLFGHGAVWDPVADGVTVPSDAPAKLAAGKFHHVPLIVGANRDEGRLFVALEYNAAGRVLTDAQWASAVDAYFGPRLGPEVRRQYPLADYPDAGAAFGQALGDAILACPAVASAAILSKYVPVYEYEFEQTPDPFVLPTPGIDLGAFHSSELPYVFDGPVESSGPITFTPAQRQLATTMGGAWARFAATGDPSGAGLAWPRLTARSGTYLDLDTPTSLQRHMKVHQCAFWAKSGFSVARTVEK